MRSHRLRQFAILGCILSGMTGPVVAHAEETEAQRLIKIKAAFILNFAKYTTWPESAFEKPDSPLVIAIVGPDTIGTVFDVTVRNQKVGEHPIQLWRPRRPTPPPEHATQKTMLEYEQKLDAYFATLRQSHLLFITEPHAEHRQQVLEQTHTGVHLTVSDLPDFAANGGMLGLVQREGRFGFDVNVKRIQKSRMMVSSKILALGRVVED